MPTNKFSIVCKAGDEVEIALYDVIDPFWGITASAIRDALKAAGNVSTIHVRINSPGGSVFEGTAIYNVLKSHAARKIVTVDGVAASMASLVAMVGDEIEMGEGAYLMVHDPTAIALGDSDEMRKMADLLDAMKGQLVGIYSRRTGRSEEDIRRMMSEETWMTADEAVKEQFADRTVPGLAVAASCDLARTQFRNVPVSLLVSPKGQSAMATQPATYQELKASFPKASAEFLTSQLDANATLEQARGAYQALLEKRAEDAEAKARRAGNSAAGASAGVVVQPEGHGDHSDHAFGDAISEWESALAALTIKGLSKQKAVSRLAATRPDLREAYVEAYNAEHAAARR